jgi:hypothetical protein
MQPAICKVVSNNIVWVKLSDSTDDAFKVRVGQDADFDDLKTDKTGERVKYIFSANDNTHCNPQADKETYVQPRKAGSGLDTGSRKSGSDREVSFSGTGNSSPNIETKLRNDEVLKNRYKARAKRRIERMHRKFDRFEEWPDIQSLAKYAYKFPEKHDFF